jgi:hypothetical protein
MMLRSAALRIGVVSVPREILALVVAIAVSGLVGLAAGGGYAFPLAGLLVFAVALVIGMLNWRWSVYGLLIYLPVSGIPVLAMYPDTTLPMLLKDILFVIPAYVGFAAYYSVRRLPFSFAGAPIVLFAMLALLVVVQAFNPSLPNRLVGAIGVKVWLMYIPLCFLGYHLVRDKQDLFRLLGLMSIVALIPAVIGIAEALLIHGGQSELVYHYYGGAAAPATQGFAQFNFQSGGFIRRIPSTFSSVTQYYIFGSSMIAVTYAWWRGYLAGTPFSFLGCLVWLVMLAAVFLSGARGAFLLGPLMVVLILLLERRRIGMSPSRALAMGVVFFATFAVIGARGGEVIGHAFETGRGELSTFVDGFRQALGVTWGGLGTGIDTGASRHAFADPKMFQAVGGTWYESWYVKVVLELGIVGLLLVALLMGSIMVRGLHNHFRLRDARLRVVSAAILAFLAWNLVYDTKAQYLDFDPINVYFWLLVGVLAKVAVLDRSSSEEQGQEALQEVQSRLL